MFKRFAILGEIGSGNLGDDLGYMLLKKELEKHFEYLQVDWITPSRFSQLDYMGYDCVVLGLGTLLDKAGGKYVVKMRELQKRKVPTVILGSGMSDPAHIVPTSEGQELFDDMRKNCAYSYLRGEAPDPMWLLGPQEGDNGQNIGINMGFAGYTTTGLFEIRQKIEFAKNYFLANNYSIKTVSAWENDIPWIGGDADIKIHRLTDLSLLKQLKAVVAFRGHLGVVAACFGVLPIAVAYSSKIREMYQNVSVPVTFLDPTQKKWTDLIEDAFTKKGNFYEAIRVAQQAVQIKVAECCQTLKQGGL